MYTGTADHTAFIRIPDVTEVVKAGSILSVLSIGVVFLTAIQALTGILQGIDQVAVPVRTFYRCDGKGCGKLHIDWHTGS